MFVLASSRNGGPTSEGLSWSKRWALALFLERFPGQKTREFARKNVSAIKEESLSLRYHLLGVILPSTGLDTAKRR